MPAPVDLRLVPAVVFSLAVCLAIPVLPYEIALGVPWWVLAGAVVCTVVLVWAGRGGRSSSGTVVAVASLAACACWIAAAAALQAVGDRVPVRESGWEAAVAAEEPVRVSGEAAGPAIRRAGPFGESWHLTVAVEAFGHPLTEVPGDGEVVVSGGEDWEGVAEGTRLCFVATPVAEGATVFARASTGPGMETEADACDASGPGAVVDQDAVEGGSTGREVVRAAVRQASSGTVGTAPQLLPGLVLGDRSVQDPALDEAMKASGLSHLSAVSGAKFVKGYRRIDRRINRSCP